MRGTHPVAVLFLEIEPDLVDVNIHPAKREVKLFDQKYVDSLILSLAGKALDRAHSLEPAMKGEGEPEKASPPPSAPGPVYSEEIASGGYLPLGEAQQGPVDWHEPEETSEAGYRVIGQALSSYLVVEKDDSLYLIDFHAAHERFLFDRLMNREEPVESQELAFPETLDLGIADFQLVMDNRDILGEMGCEIDEFSGEAVVIRSVPALRGVQDGASLVRSFLDEVRREGWKKETMREGAAASIACHSARRSGDRLDRDEMDTLASLVLEGKQELRCPHGRPYLLTLGRNEIEKMVRRT
jgi:DNA mismatch repair protein MutL